MRLVAAIILLIAIAGCGSVESTPDDPVALSLDVPATFDPVPMPELNPVTAAKVALGERLFFDTILSRDRTVSCASCHDPDHAFADPRPLSLGVDNRVGIRNSMSLVNVAYQDLLFWDGGALSLENQALAPIEDDREMDAELDTLLARLNAEPSYSMEFQDVFGGPASIATMTQALASFQRTIRTVDSRFDRYLDGATSELTDREIRGLQVFNGKAGCADCHAGVLLTTQEFANNGLSPAGSDSGRARITLNPDDFGRFKVPSLRNVSLTAPYMHDGRFRSLEEVVTHYNTGGSGVRGQDDRIHPLDLSQSEMSDLIAFLNALTDESIVAGSETIVQ